MGDHEAPSRFRAVVFGGLPLACLASAAAAGAVWGRGWSDRWAVWPWLVSLAVVGLPHGAVDWALTRRTCPTGAMQRLVIAYLAGMLAVLGLFVALPVPAVTLFAALSVWHFGMAHADGQWPPLDGTPATQAIAALARGGLVLAVPMARWPVETAAVADHVVALTAPRPATFDPVIVQSAGLTLVAAAVAALAVEGARTWADPGARRRSLATAAEMAVFAGLGLTTVPLFSVGMYFLCWHAWRQMLLLAAVVTGTTPTGPVSLARSLTAIHVAALPLLVPTWLVLGAAWWLLSPAHSAADLATLSLVVYLVVTPSHDLLIDWVRHRAATAAVPPPRSARRCTAPSAFWSP